jgi:hypothetical protein
LKDKEMPFQTELNTKEAAKRPPQGEHIELWMRGPAGLGLFYGRCL